MPKADLHTLLVELAERKLIHSARDISDGGIAVALAQAAFAKGIGATVEQEQSLDGPSALRLVCRAGLDRARERRAQSNRGD